MSKTDKPGPEDDGDADQGFLSRWSRRKAAAREARPEEPISVEPAVEEDVIDPATLPSIDSLTAESDFSLFLKKGVPSALRAAALRKLWLVEPSVVNYKPLVEYNWDFTAPGYGELLPTDNVAKLLKDIFQGSQAKAVQREELPPTETAEVTEAAKQEAEQLPAPTEQTVETPVAAIQPVEDVAPVAPMPRRRHGGALPT